MPKQQQTDNNIDIGLYKPEELICRNGDRVIAIYTNPAPEDSGYYYSVTYFSMSTQLYQTSTAFKNGKFFSHTDSDRDVLLNLTLQQEQLCKAMSLFKKLGEETQFDHLDLHFTTGSSGTLNTRIGLYNFKSLRKLINILEEQY